MSRGEQIRTLADYFEAAKSDVTGGPDFTMGRRSRMKDLIVDGEPLGDHAVDAPTEKKARSRFKEMQWLAISLLGCDADLELRDVRRLDERSVPTADFEATTKGGEILRIELGNVVDEEEMRSDRAIRRIESEVQRRLSSNVAGMGGEFASHLYPGAAPIGSYVAPATAEFIGFIREIAAVAQPSRKLHPAGSKYGTLEKLGARLAYRGESVEPKFKLRAAHKVSDHSATMKSFMSLLSKTGGYPVWLVLAVESPVVPFLAIGFVQYLQSLNTIDPAPFERVLVGCYTAGVTFTDAGHRPRYTSLDTTG